MLAPSLHRQYTDYLITQCFLPYHSNNHRMLGYSGSTCIIRSSDIPDVDTGVSLNDTFGVGTGPVWLHNVQCDYDDRSLDDCRHSGLREDWCSHSRDVIVICEGVAQVTLFRVVIYVKDCSACRDCCVTRLHLVCWVKNLCLYSKSRLSRELFNDWFYIYIYNTKEQVHVYFLD